MGGFWNTVKKVVTFSPVLAIAGAVAPKGSRVSGATSLTDLTNRGVALTQQKRLEAEERRAQLAAVQAKAQAEVDGAYFPESVGAAASSNAVLIVAVLAFIGIGIALFFKLRKT